MNTTLNIGIEDCTIELLHENNLIKDITIHRNDNKYVVGLDKYTNLFPDYKSFERFIGHSLNDMIDACSRSEYYTDLIRELDNTTPTTISIRWEKLVYFTYFEPPKATYMHLCNTPPKEEKLELFIHVGTDEDGNVIGCEIHDHNVVVGKIEYVVYDDRLEYGEKVEELMQEYEYNTLLDLTSGKYKIDYIRGLLKYWNKDSMLGLLEYLSLKHGLGTDELICIKNPESDRSEEGDGIPSCLTLISENRWEYIKCIVEQYSTKLSYIEHDCSNGGYGCILEYNFHQMTNECQVIDDLSEDAIIFIKKVEETQFINELLECLYNCE